MFINSYYSYSYSLLSDFFVTLRYFDITFSANLIIFDYPWRFLMYLALILIICHHFPSSFPQIRIWKMSLPPLDKARKMKKNQGTYVSRCTLNYKHNFMVSFLYSTPVMYVIIIEVQCLFYTPSETLIARSYYHGFSYRSQWLVNDCYFSTSGCRYCSANAGYGCGVGLDIVILQVSKPVKLRLCY